MTYGDVTHELRTALTDALTAQRPRRQLLRREEPIRDVEALLLRYRRPILTWLAESTRVVGPRDQPKDPLWGPPALFAQRLRVSVERTPRADLPSAEELATPHPHPHVDAWRRAAVAATEGNLRETKAFDAGLPRADRLGVVADTVALTNAMIILDDRYDGAQDWPHLGNRSMGKMSTCSEGLLVATQLCRTWLSDQPISHGHDHAGYRARSLDVGASLREDLPGVVDALEHVTTALDKAPRGHALRAVLRTQLAVSIDLRDLARTAGADNIADYLTARASAYQRLGVETRNLGGAIGSTGTAAIAAAEHARAVIATAPTGPVDELQRAVGALRDTDELLRRHLATGLRDKSLVIADGKRLGPLVRGVRPAIPKWRPASMEQDPDLLATVRGLANLPTTNQLEPSSEHTYSRGALVEAVEDHTSKGQRNVKDAALVPRKESLSLSDRAALLRSSFPTPAAAQASEAYLRRRPQRAAGGPARGVAKKSHGPELG